MLASQLTPATVSKPTSKFGASQNIKKKMFDNSKIVAMFQTFTSSINTRIGFVQQPIVEIVLDCLVLDEEEKEFIMEITLKRDIISII